MLTQSVYTRTETCTLEQLGLARTGPKEYALKILRPATQPRPHSAAKLQQWATYILLSSLGIAVGSSIGRFQAPRLRHAPPVLETYEWSLTSDGGIAGRPKGIARALMHNITLYQGTYIIHWWCRGPTPKLADGSSIEQRAFSHELREQGLVVEAHPHLHRYPWAVPDTTPNRSVQAALKRQAFRFHK